MKYIFKMLTLFSLTWTLTPAAVVRGQEAGEKQKVIQDVNIYFRFDKSVIDTGYMSNRISLMRLDTILHNKKVLAAIDSLEISSYASPEGNPSYNDALAKKRALSFKTYLLDLYPFVDKYPILTKPMGENWDGLKELVLKDTNLPGRSQILMILDKPIGSLEKEEQIKAVMDGAAWRYIEKNMLRYLRAVSCLMFYIDPVKMADTDTVRPAVVQPPVTVVTETIVTETEVEKSEPDYRIVRPVAFKTNLLFDAATALNVEVEVPVAKRFSIAGEWIFPWWLWEDKQNCLEVLSGNLEARYWFRPNFTKQDPSLGLHNPLTGWFVGLYGGGGKYDLEWKREGYQGEFFIATGVSGGYVLPLNRNISMEFSLGLGILRTKYRHYHAEFCEVDNRWHLIRQFNGRHTWIGPTKAKISFIWYPHFKMKKKGGNL